MNKYHEVANKINTYIQENNLTRGHKLPTLTELEGVYEVSKNTIIKALEVLETNGVIYQVRGSGTYVRGRHRKGFVNLTDVQGFHSIFREFNLSSEVIELKEIEAPSNVAEILELKDQETIYYIKRVRYIESRPFCVEESYYLKTIVPYLNEEIASQSIFNYLTEDLKINIRFSDLFMRIGKLNQEEAAYLQLETHDPSLTIESIYYLNSGRPFNYSNIKYHYEEAQFFVQGNNF